MEIVLRKDLGINSRSFPDSFVTPRGTFSAFARKDFYN